MVESEQIRSLYMTHLNAVGEAPAEYFKAVYGGGKDRSQPDPPFIQSTPAGIDGLEIKESGCHSCKLQVYLSIYAREYCVVLKKGGETNILFSPEVLNAKNYACKICEFQLSRALLLAVSQLAYEAKPIGGKFICCLSQLLVNIRARMPCYSATKHCLRLKGLLRFQMEYHVEK